MMQKTLAVGLMLLIGTTVLACSGTAATPPAPAGADSSLPTFIYFYTEN